MSRQFVSDQESNSLLAIFFVKLLERIKRTEPLKLIWWCLALSILSATLARYTTVKTGLTYDLMVILGSGGCAWFWLLSRTLFHDSKSLKSKIVFLVPAIIVIEAIEALMPPAGVNTITNEFYRVFNNVASVVCIAAIVFVWNETLRGFNKIRSKPERRFRLIFLIFFSMPVAVAIFWVMGAEAESFAAKWNDTLMLFCAFMALVSSRTAVEYRLRTAHNNTIRSMHTSDGLDSDNSSKKLADKVLLAIRNDALLTQTNLKVADLAKHLGAQEYKVTRCITSHLQYRNFNHMVNCHRIDRAIQNFKNPNKSHLNVATIAFDCGFNSLGPFNRAFKQHTDMTPSEFRQRLEFNTKN